MKIINILTKKHLIENKRRTIVTIIGIIISVAMITAVFVTTTSFFDFFKRLGYISDGNAEATFRLIPLKTIEQIKNDERTDRVGIISEDEECSGYTLLSGTTMRAKRGTIYTADSVNLNQVVSCNYEGTLPRCRNEIAVEESLLKANNLDLSIGDTLSMDLGKRTVINESGVEEPYHNTYQSSENFYKSGTQDCVITAILHQNKATSSFKILRGMNDEETAAVPDGRLSAMISLKNVNFRSYGVIMDMIKQYGIEKYSINTEVLDACFSLRKDSSFVEMLPVLTFVTICIVFFSVILIYNAFGMSLAERVKYLGMIASVGATKRQKRLSVFYEGFILGVIGIPVGILAGIAGIAVTLKFVGARLITSGIFPAIEHNPRMTDIHLCVPLWVLPFIIAVSILTIYIAALVPAVKASKIMPVDAIRQTNEIKVKNNDFKVPKIVRSIFGYEGELAYKNLKRNGRKGKVIIFSIVASMVMFLGMNYFCKLFWESNNKSYNLPFSVFASASYSEKDRLYEDLASIPGVDDIFGIDMFAYEYKSGDMRSPNMDIMNPEHFTKSYRRVFDSQMLLMLHLVSDEDFTDLCNRQGIDSTPYFGNDTNALLLNNVTYKKDGNEVFTESMLGQKLFYDGPDKGNPAVVTIRDFFKWEDNPHILGMYQANIVTAVIPYSTYVRTVYGDNIPENLCISYGLVTDSHEEVLSEVDLILDTGKYHETFCEDVISSQGAMATVLYVLKVFTYGFITLISLITVTNILNTISTGILQRRKEFAMLKSVGMTPAGFMKMIRLESSLYGIKSTLWGIPISLLACFIMNRLLPVSGLISPNYYLFILAVVVIFTLIWLSMMLSVSGLKKDTIVDVLKEEIN